MASILARSLSAGAAPILPGAGSPRLMPFVTSCPPSIQIRPIRWREIHALLGVLKLPINDRGRPPAPRGPLREPSRSMLEISWPNGLTEIAAAQLSTVV